jgi:hypothetical protein
MNAADPYAAMADAVEAQRARLLGPLPADRWSGARARGFRQDPRRPLDPNLATIATYLRPEDVLIDVGGGAGRYGLPLASRCRELVNVEPSPGMAAEYEASATEAGIRNANLVRADWRSANGVVGDVTLVCHVTYFVRDIVPFVRKLEEASRRRVIIDVVSVPPPNQTARLFELVFGEPMALRPGYRELLPVLWEMGILPDVRVLPARFGRNAAAFPKTREEAVDAAVATLDAHGLPHVRQAVETRFDQLFKQTAEGFEPRYRQGSAAEMLITWEPLRGGRHAT